MATIAEKLAALAVVDDFNRNESPLLNVKGSALNGTWVLLKPGKAKGKVETGGAKGWTPSTPFSEGADGAYYSKTSFAGGANYIASLFRLTTQPGVTTPNRYLGVWVYRDKTTPETKESGYFLRVEYLSGEGASTKWKLKLEKWVNGVVTEMKTVETAAGDYTSTKESRFALVVGGGKVFCFASKEKASAFEQILETTDATYTEGYSAVLGAGTGTVGMQDFATGTLELEESAGIHKPNTASATASEAEPAVVSGAEWGTARATASMPTVEAANGAMPSPTNDQRHGLPLPFPSVLANPGRLGPPRYTAAERKTLRIER